MVSRKGDVGMFRSYVFGVIPIFFVKIPTVQFKHVTKYESAVMARSSRNSQDSTGVTRTSQNARSSLPCFSQQSQDQKRHKTQNIAQLARQAHCPIYTLSRITRPPTGLASAKHHVHLHHTTQPKTSTSLMFCIVCGFELRSSYSRSKCFTH